MLPTPKAQHNCRDFVVLSPMWVPSYGTIPIAEHSDTDGPTEKKDAVFDCYDINILTGQIVDSQRKFTFFDRGISSKKMHHDEVRSCSPARQRAIVVSRG